MARNRLLFTILALAVALCLVGESLAGKGNGKGNGGGGDPLPGLIYVRTCTPVASGAFGDCDNHQARAMQPDGTIQQTYSFPNLGHPSHALHGGKRYFLGVRPSTVLNPDGSYRSILLAKDENNTKHDLTAGDEDIDIFGGVRWTKDDGAVSFAATVWDAGGTASNHVFYAEVTWDANGIPSLVADPDAILDEVSGESLRDGFAGRQDWSPDGDRLAYGIHDGSTDRIRIATFDLSSSPPALVSTSALDEGWDPRWSPAASSERIVFTRAWVVYGIDSDGSDLTQVSGSGDERHSPRWSPDGAHIAFGKSKDIKIKGQSNFTVNVMIVPAAGGSPSNVTSGDKDRYEVLYGWRD